MDLAMDWSIMALLDALATVSLVLDVPEPVNPRRKLLWKLSAIIRRRCENTNELKSNDVFTPTLDRADLGKALRDFKEAPSHPKPVRTCTCAEARFDP